MAQAGEFQELIEADSFTIRPWYGFGETLIIFLETKVIPLATIEGGEDERGHADA